MLWLGILRRLSVFILEVYIRLVKKKEKKKGKKQGQEDAPSSKLNHPPVGQLGQAGTLGHAPC